MKRCLIAFFAAMVLISSCAGHFYRMKDDQVTFYLDLPNAQNVYISCSFDEFRLHKIEQKQSGTWEIAVPADMEFRYFFIVDGMLYLPDCHIRETDDFGSENCIFEPDR